MKCFVLLLSLVVFLARPAQANPSQATETKDVQTYGNCHVSTQVDMLTDAVSHGLICYQDSLTDRTLIGVQDMDTTPGDPWIKKRELVVTLSKGVQFLMDNHIPVIIRIDKQKPIHREARWDGAQYAFIQSTALALDLLKQLAQGERVAIQVGKERGHVRLNGSARAIQDFKRRAGLISQARQPQKTLTPQQRQTLDIPSHNQ